MDIILQNRFARYAQSFLTGDENTDRNLRLKEEHTFCVLKEARTIMAGEAVSPEEFSLGEIAALLHDLSRFEQIIRFRTFRDASSFDHGAESGRLAEADHWLDDLVGDDRRDVLFAIIRHNQMAIGDAPSPRAKKLAGIVRDADKIDIFRVFLQYLQQNDNPAITFSLADVRVVSPEILAAIREKRPADHAKMKSVVDFLAAKIQWAYDLNTATARKIFLERDLLKKLGAFFTDVPEIPELLHAAENDLRQKQA